MSTAEARQAAALLWAALQQGGTVEALPAALRPATRHEGYVIQAAWPEVAGDTVAGWKIAATSAAGQAHINVGGPLAGRVLARRVHEAGATVSLRGNRMRVAEPEFAFRFARDLPPRGQPYTVDEVLQAVGTLHLAFEVPDSRYTEFVVAGEAQILADNACGNRFVLGPATAADWRALDLSTHAVHAEVRRADGSAWQRQGSGAAVLGDPRVALAWLVNELSSLGETLRGGQWVSTGTCMVPLEVLPGDRAVADYGVLGRLDVRFVD